MSERIGRFVFAGIALALATVFAADAPANGGVNETDLSTLGPLTVAEASDYEATASHDEVLTFLDQLLATGAPVQIESLGKSTEGRDLAVAILADPPVQSPPSPADRDRLVIFVQANIHAGEVEGKEAVLMLLRDIGLRKQFPEILENCILLVIPNYNPDGNDKFDDTKRNRPSQTSPKLVGKRRNAQNLDLNRDYMKARSTEFPHVARNIFNTWDPDLFMDLHTTNGSYHGYTLTYAPPLHPGGAREPLELTRDRLLPDVRKAMRDEHGYETFDYGNFNSQKKPTRWATYDYRARMGWLYAGVRGRIGILSEAYAYAAYQNRVDATYCFVQEICSWAANHKDEILAMHRKVDSDTMAWGRNPETAPEIAIRAKLVQRAEDEYMLIEESGDPAEGARRGKRTGLIYSKKLEVFDRFEPTETVKYPAGYVIPPAMTEALEMLELHGVRADKIEAAMSVDAEHFVPTSVKTANLRFSGGLQTRVTVERKPAKVEIPAGHYYVPTAQRQGRLAVHLLEPDAADSLVTWDRTGFTATEGTPLPYLRVMSPPKRP